jgi:hypothetical protein
VSEGALSFGFHAGWADCRSLGYARDDKGEDRAFLCIARWTNVLQWSDPVFVYPATAADEGGALPFVIPSAAEGSAVRSTGIKREWKQPLAK